MYDITAVHLSNLSSDFEETVGRLHKQYGMIAGESILDERHRLVGLEVEEEERVGVAVDFPEQFSAAETARDSILRGKSIVIKPVDPELSARPMSLAELSKSSEFRAFVGAKHDEDDDFLAWFHLFPAVAHERQLSRQEIPSWQVVGGRGFDAEARGIILMVCRTAPVSSKMKMDVMQKRACRVRGWSADSTIACRSECGHGSRSCNVTDDSSSSDREAERMTDFSNNISDPDVSKALVQNSVSQVASERLHQNSL